MVRYVKTIDELVDIIDKEFSGSNAVCPICKNKIGSVNIPNVELGIPEFYFMQYKQPGVFCTEGHCIISMETEEDKKPGHDVERESGNYKIFIEDLGIKVYEAMKLIKPYLELDKSIPNVQLYWIIMDKNNRISTKGLPYDDALDLLDRLQKIGVRARIG